MSYFPFNFLNGSNVTGLQFKKKVKSPPNCVEFDNLFNFCNYISFNTLCLNNLLILFCHISISVIYFTYQFIGVK